MRLVPRRPAGAEDCRDRNNLCKSPAKASRLNESVRFRYTQTVHASAALPARKPAGAKAMRCSKTLPGKAMSYKP